MKIIIAITGASGAIYARLLTERLNAHAQVAQLFVVLTGNGQSVMEYEEGGQWLARCDKVTVLDNRDFYTGIASGSGDCAAMVVVPSSVGMIGRVAGGISNDLVSRACDVMLKERRKLIFVVRETPLNLIHLNNLTQLTQAGAIILPASPSFYARPTTIEALCGSVVDRIISLLGLADGQYRWGSDRGTSDEKQDS